jgi:hypothetical protein
LPLKKEEGGLFVFVQNLIRVPLLLAGIFFNCCVPQGNSAAAPGSEPGRSVEKQEPADTGASQKYREILFPKGMPMEEDPDSGQKKQSVYAFYGEAKMDDSLTAVLYSEKIPTTRADADYTVMVSILATSGGAWKVASTLDLTESMPVETEGPGNFYKMDGRLDAFVIAAGNLGLHVDLWATLAGSGATSAASDLFFQLTPDQKLKPLLELKKTSQFSRIGASASTTVDSRILVGDINEDGKAEIIVEKSQLNIENGKRQAQTEKPVVYEFLDNKYVLKGPIDASVIASHRQKLKPVARSRFIRTLISREAATGSM